MSVHVSVEAKVNFKVISELLSALFCEAGSPTGIWGLTVWPVWLGLLAREPKGGSCLCLFSCGIMYTPLLQPLHEYWGLNLVSQAT